MAELYSPEAAYRSTLCFFFFTTILGEGRGRRSHFQPAESSWWLLLIAAAIWRMEENAPENTAGKIENHIQAGLRLLSYWTCPGWTAAE